VVVIGGGPNGLAAAALLAKGGLKPIVLERREVVGGAAVTEEFHPGFRVSTVAHTAGPLRPKLARALDLQRHGLEWMLPEPRVFAPHPDGRGLSLFGDPAQSASEIARFSAKDADAYRRMIEEYDEIKGVFGRARMTPHGFGPSLEELLLEHPRGRIEVTVGTRLAPNTVFMGIDLAAWLEEEQAKHSK